MTWYQKAMSIIATQKSEVAHLPKNEQKKYCSENYPFGERRYFPYKAWCKAMRHNFGKPEPVKLKHIESSGNQLPLFNQPKATGE
jgi:hypothetical protein